MMQRSDVVREVAASCRQCCENLEKKREMVAVQIAPRDASVFPTF
jgi:hypothetical protein